MKKTVLLAIAAVILMTSSLQADGGSEVWYSVVFPGWGQMKAGRYGRGTVFLSLGVISLTALAMTEVQYNRAVEEYESARAGYLNATYIGDAITSYDRMNSEWDSAETLHTYRQALLWTYVGVWAFNVIDMLAGPEAKEPPVSMTVGTGGFYVSKTFTF